MIFVLPIAAVSVVMIVIYTGSFIPPHFHIKYSENYSVSSEIIWNTLINMDRMAERSRFAKRVERIGKNHLGFPIWREYSGFGVWSEFEIIGKIPSKKLTINLLDSSYGIKGKWSYELDEKDGKTTVTITENSEIHQFTVRLPLILTGRDFHTRKRFRILEKSLSHPDSILTSH
ncbi:hypothetical protein [Bacillus marinisedimentorum]|uniref:hypothetical protein n=1 Tax=Bacillus marinisedimentorum TaxID=1821260 RepID=UPI000872CCAA|nr:hypothetical protein [Bacillus marinisedimentorum]